MKKALKPLHSIFSLFLIFPFLLLGINDAYAQDFSMNIDELFVRVADKQINDKSNLKNAGRIVLANELIHDLECNITSPGAPIPSLPTGDHQIFLPLVSNEKFTLPELIITSLSFTEENFIAHHTEHWPDYVFRRVQWLQVQVEFSGDFNSLTDKVLWSVQTPNQEVYTPVPDYSSELVDTSWAVKTGNAQNGYRIDELFIPVKAPLGQFHLKASLYRDNGSGFVLSEEEYSPAFYVIFNPWNDDSDPRFDADVYNPNFISVERSWYALNGSDVNYYSTYDPSIPKVWDLSMYSDVVFLPVVEEVQGISSAREAMAVLIDKARWDHVDDIPQVASDIINGTWNEEDFEWNWQDVPAMMIYWDYGNAHPTGECMDFGGLVAAFGKAIGIPTRMLTLWCDDCGGFKYHVWNETWLNEVSTKTWSPVDGTYNTAPTTRLDPHFQWYVEMGLHLYTYDARTGERVDIIGQY